MKARAASITVCLIAMVVVGAVWLEVLAIRRPLLRGPTGEALADPDSYQRYGLVRRALAGEGVRIRWIDADNAPFGRTNEWTSPVTILVVAGTRWLQAAGWSEEDALARVCLWYGPVLGLVQLAVWCVLGYQIGGWPLALAWMLAWVPLLPVMRTTAFGCIDHHSLHQLAAILMVVGPVAAGARSTVGKGIMAGVAAGVGLWSGASEVLPFWWLVAALAVWELWPRRSQNNAESVDHLSRYWRGWWVSGMAVTIAAWLWEFWPSPFHRQLEFLSTWHITLWLLAGILVEYLIRHRPESLCAWRVVGIVVLVALLAAGAQRSFQWHDLHVMQDVRFVAQTAVIHEFESWWRLGWWAGIGRLWRGYGLLPLLAVLGLVAMWRELTRRERWVWAVLGLLGALTIHQLRWESFLVVPLVAAAGLAARVLSSGHGIWTPVLVFVATLPAWGTIGIVHKQSRTLAAVPMQGPHANKFALTAVSRCLGEHDPGAVVLAGWDHGAVLAGLGEVRVVGSAYWSNLDGLFSGHELLTTSDLDRFRALAAERQVRWLLVPGLQRFRADIEQAYLVLHGRLPTPAEIEQAVVWQLALDPQLPRLHCELLASVAQGWELIRLVQP